MVTELFGTTSPDVSDPVLDRLRRATLGSYDVAGELGKGRLDSLLTVSNGAAGLTARLWLGITGAELGAMKVTEQIDALEAVAVDSFSRWM